jgi:hypothetical protein
VRYDINRIENDASNSSFVVACVFVAAVTILLSHRLATIWRYTYKHTDRWEGFMKYPAEMGSGVKTYIPSIIKIASGIQ